MYYNKSLQKFLDDLAARKPAPGGGAAAALAGAMGAALIGMVVNFTLGKPAYLGYNAQLKSILAHAQRLRKKFLRLLDADVQAYQGKDAAKSLSVPLEVCDLCEKAIGLCGPLLTKGNKNLVSDVAVAAVLLEAAFACAYANVLINLQSARDRQRVAKIRKALAASAKKIRRIRATTEAAFGARVRR